MPHGSSTCSRCEGVLVRDMYGVWYHDASQEGIEKYNDDDHAPEPQQADLIAIRRAEQLGMDRASRLSEREQIKEAIKARLRIVDNDGAIDSLQAVIRIIDNRP